jgi:hypothetical protein
MMQSGLGHHVVWFWRRIPGLSSQVVRRWRRYVLTETSVPTSQTTHSHNSEDCNYESQHSAFSLHCMTNTKQLNTLGNKYTLLFYIIFGCEQKYVGEYII